MENSIGLDLKQGKGIYRVRASDVEGAARLRAEGWIVKVVPDTFVCGRVIPGANATARRAQLAMAWVVKRYGSSAAAITALRKGER